jgi:hypothetical protein
MAGQTIGRDHLDPLVDVIRFALAVSMQSESSFEAIFLLAGYAEAGRVPTALQLG